MFTSQPEKLRVLLIEDDEDDYLLTRDLLGELESFHVELEWQRDPERAVDHICEAKHDLCLMDYRLGALNGLELLEQATSRGCSMPIILMTGLGDRAIDLAATRVGAADYLVKGELSAAALDRSLRYVIQRKRSEEMVVLRRRNEALAEADRRKDEFLAMLAHELRNPIGALRNATTMLERMDPDPPRRQRAVNVLSRQIRHLTRLVDDLLDVSRITNGKIVLETERIDGAVLVRQVVEDFAPQVYANELKLEVSLATGPVWLMADSVRLAQAIGNLLSNAAKFAPEHGLVRVRSSVIAAPPQFCIEVFNDGPPIDLEIQESLFDPFVQGAQSLARTRGGLGLGLALVKALANLHGGAVELATDTADGVEFRLCLPLAEDEAGPDAGARLSTDQAVSGRRILLIEDNLDIAETMRDLLVLTGHEVMIAPDGETALREGPAFQPDTLLCDLGLPGMDGCAVARAFRALPNGGELLMIAQSGYGRGSDVEACLAAGFNHHVVKPVDLACLQALLAR